MTTNCNQAIDFGECLSFPPQPPPKKARVEIDAQEEFEEQIRKCEAMDDSGDCLPLPSSPPPTISRVETKADELAEACRKCNEEFKKSEGFDIQTFPDASKLLKSVQKVLFDLKHIPTDIVDMFLYYKFGCIFSLNYAIYKENQKQKKKITFDKIIKSNTQKGYVYFTTFMAKDEVTGASKIYQTQVCSSIMDGENDVEIFRERADQALQPGEDAQGVDIEVFPNLPAPADPPRLVNLDIYALGEDVYYLTLCYMSIRFALNEMDQKENTMRTILKVIKSAYGADLLFRTTFMAEDIHTKECKTYEIEVFFNLKNGELELQKFKESSSIPNSN